MAKPLKNISDLFKNSRTRSILIVTIGLVILGVVVGIVSLRKKTASPSRAGLEGTPQIQSIPGGFEKPESQEYVNLQNQQNLQKAEAARKAGTSAVPTIVSSSPITGGWQGEFSSVTQGQGLPNNYLLRPSGPADAEGVPVYNAQGIMTGMAYGKGDRVCVVNCTATGMVSPDGLIRDARGNVIGKVAASALGTPVYDADGRLIGYAGPDGKVRNTKGAIVGSIGPDGVFKDNAGTSGKGALGAPVYDSNGRLLGYAAPNGVVRGLNGNLLGKLGPDGVVRAPNGSTLGRVGSTAARGAGTVGPTGTPVYDKNGNLIGYADPSGTVRDRNGRAVGSLAADGTMRDANGNVIGSVATPKGPTGTPVYDKNGNLIGYADPKGVLRNPSGRLLGNLAPDGTARDASGNLIGTGGTGTPGTSSVTSGGPSGILPTESDQQQTARQRQQQQLDQQLAQQNLQQLTSNMTTQQGLLFTSWSSTSTQQHVEGTKPHEEIGVVHNHNVAEGLEGPETSLETTSVDHFGGHHSPRFLKAGTILFATLNTAVNSDEPGPVMATIVGNRLRGGKLLGTLINQGQKVMLTFNVLNLPNVPESISINAVAIDPDTARTALSSDTDNHYLLRYGSMFAASFLQGYGQAILQSGQTFVTNGLNTIVTNENLSPRRTALAALGTVGQAWGEAIRPLFNKPPTVQVYACTPLGILIMSDVAPPI